jgi:hypothetical protein
MVSIAKRRTCQVESDLCVPDPLAEQVHPRLFGVAKLADERIRRHEPDKFYNRIDCVHIPHKPDLRSRHASVEV